MSNKLNANIPYFDRIDHLRAFAIICVSIFEFKNFSQTELSPKWLQIPFFDHGQSGVTLFMVISGFIFAAIASKGEQINLKQFYLNRILRIYPLFITVISLGYFVTPDPRPTQIGIDFLMSLLPISNLYRLDYGKFGGMFWSIAVEIQFYLLFPLLWPYIKDWKRALTLIVFLILIRALAYTSSNAGYDFVYFSIFGSLDVFVIGCLAHKVYSKNLNQNSTLVPIFFCCIAAFITLWETGLSKVNSKWIIANTLLAFAYGAVMVTYLRSRRALFFGSFFALIGRVSYSIYAWQIIFFYALINYIPKGVMGAYQLGGVIFLVGIFPFSILSYYILEKPFIEMRKNYIE